MAANFEEKPILREFSSDAPKWRIVTSG